MQCYYIVFYNIQCYYIVLYNMQCYLQEQYDRQMDTNFDYSDTIKATLNCAYCCLLSTPCTVLSLTDDLAYSIACGNGIILFLNF